ncbi:hypothetical protein RHGRI_011334 [Rhododendron griersonianum]|uniref:Uncharacterized protein n=1 Tax=Rhododendron griersonianum TaxID=479676 RepID=A0AAV6KLH5_9ERIC|nr:hypothetical protein RHGRI_011334 [Rhododendron griersonianum]
MYLRHYSAHLILSHFDPPNLYLFNNLITRDSIHLFSNWVSKSAFSFDDSTCVFVLGACAWSCTAVPALFEGKQVHARVIKHGFLSNVIVGTTAVHFYASNRDVGFVR